MLFVVGIGEVIAMFARLKPHYLLLYLLVSVTIFFGFLLRWKIILRVLGHKIPIFKLFFFRASGWAVSYLTPFAKIGGEPVRTYFLTKENVPLTDAVSSVVIDKMLELTANALFTSIGIIVIIFTFTLPKKSIAVIVWAMLIFISLLGLFYYRMLQGKGFFTSIIDWLKLERFKKIKDNRWRIRDAEKVIARFFSYHKKQFIICTIISLLLWMMTFLEYTVLTWVFGYRFAFPVIFAVVIMIGISTLFPVPAALGMQEAGQVTIFSVIRGGSGKIGFAVSLITRIRDVLWTSVGLGYMYHKGMKKLVKKELRQKKDKIKWNF